MKTLLIVLAMVPNGKYHSIKEFMKEKHYTVESACKIYQAHDCEIKQGQITYCMGDFGEGGCDPWELWGIKNK